MTTEPEVVDAEVVDHEPVVESTALARRERRSEVLRPLAVDALVSSFDEYQAMLPRLLDASDYQNAGAGKRFVKKSGWRKIATAFDLDVILVDDEVERDEHGHAVRAKVIARAIAPSGRTMDGDGYCSVDENRFARGNREKLENDLRGTATTRAKNRAISDLVGMGDVSAEEVSSGDVEQQGPAYGPAVTKGTASLASNALKVIYDGDQDAAERVWNAIKANLGYMPECVASSLPAIASGLVDA